MARRLSIVTVALAVTVAGAAFAVPPTRSTSTRPSPPPAPVVKSNPLLPSPVAIEGFFPELSLVQKLPTITPAGFEPLYTPQDWTTWKTRFGQAAEELPRKKSSGQFEFAQSLIEAADAAKHPDTTPGFRRLLLLRAATICYRSTGGFPTADKAVAAYQKEMDIKSPAQVGALWTITNQMSRMAVTPKAERIRYSAIAAKANIQLSLLMLEADQVAAADSMIKLIGYHEGWLRSDPATRLMIVQARSVVKRTATMMDYLATQYQPAIRGDDGALMVLFLYGRFVKNDSSLVADFPSRKPTSAMAQLAGQLDSADRDVTANFTAAESLKTVAHSLPDGVLKQRTLYAALERYRKFIRAPETERERVKRTLALMAIESAVADGAAAGITLRPFAPPPTTQPTTQSSTTQPATRPAPEPIRAVG